MLVRRATAVRFSHSLVFRPKLSLVPELLTHKHLKGYSSYSTDISGADQAQGTSEERNDERLLSVSHTLPSSSIHEGPEPRSKPKPKKIIFIGNIEYTITSNEFEKAIVERGIYTFEYIRLGVCYLFSYKS